MSTLDEQKPSTSRPAASARPKSSSGTKVLRIDNRNTLTNIVMISILLLALCAALLHFWLLPRLLAPKFDTEYQAVILTSGIVYFGKIDRLWTPYPELTDIFYVQAVRDQESGQAANVLIKRGNELHAPDRMVLNAENILMIEPVTPGSQVAARIAEQKAQQ